VATQAYVFVYVTPGKVETAAKAIARLEGVTSAHACWGPDVIVFAEVPSNRHQNRRPDVTSVAQLPW
jgi:hypothetical protein